MLTRLILIKILFIHYISCYPSVVIKTGAQSGEAEQQKHDAGNHNVKFKVGTSGFNSATGYNKGNENNHAQALDAGKYSEQSGNKKQHVDQANYAGQKFQHQGGDTIADVGKQGWNKKGHHKSGFHNTYKKDESGSNSSYYDDGNDEGGQFYHNSQKGTYGDTSSHGSQGAHLDGRYNAQEDAKRGGYDKGGSYQKGAGDSKIYNQENYHNNQENGGRVNGGNQYEASGGHNAQKYHQQYPPYVEQPYYYEQPYYVDRPRYYDRAGYVGNYYDPAPYDSYNVPEKKTITIYEDPRIYDQEYSQYQRYPLSRNGYGDLVQLDVRPPLQTNLPQYRYTKPVYENSYY